MKAYTGAEMKSADKYTIENLQVPGIILMDRAASGVYKALEPYFEKNKSFVILCGNGNNGGDGWALAEKLWDIHEGAICISVTGEPVTEDAIHFYDKCKSFFKDRIIYAQKNLEKALDAVRNADVVVEAIFGTGFCGDIDMDSIAGQLIVTANTSSCTRIAVDIPAGADALRGCVSDVSFNADKTITFAKPKIGMYSYPAREKCGEIIVVDIGIPDSAFGERSIEYEISDKKLIRSLLPKRYTNSNKGSYGKLLCVVGSENMPGAASLAVSGALRCGVGLVCVSSSEKVTDTLKIKHSEPVFLPLNDSEKDTEALIEYSKHCSAVLIGCGIGRTDAVQKKVVSLIRGCECPIILDADGINAVCSDINILKEAKNGILLTPHPMEFSRLSSLSVSEINGNRLKCAEDFSREYGCTLLLKGAGTVIADKGRSVCVNTTGNSALSKGGSGDVLSGMIASFVSQGASLYHSAIIGAYLHGLAGESLALQLSEYGVLPSEIPKRAAEILREIVSDGTHSE